MTLSSLTKAIILLGALTTLGFFIVSGAADSLEWWLDTFWIMPLLIAPFGLYWLMQIKMVQNKSQQVLLLCSTTTYYLIGFSIMYQAAIESKILVWLVSVVIPVYGSLLIIFTAIALLFMRKLK